MAERAFAFWLEKEREMSSNPPEDRNRVAAGRVSGTGDKNNTFPRRESSGEEARGLSNSLTKSSASINTIQSDIDPSELFRPTRPPIRATRPQSCAPSYTRTAKSLPSLQTSTTPHGPAPGGEDSSSKTSRTSPAHETIKEDEECPPSSAPSAQSSKRWWNRPSHPPTTGRHHSVSPSSYSFVSYIDGPIRSSTQTQFNRTSRPSLDGIGEDPSPGPISRSSPVVTRPTRARAHSNSRTRNVLRPRTKLTTPSEDELKDFWNMVLRAMETVTNKQIYLKSPTISRYQPQATPPIATPSPPGHRRVGHQSVRGGVATPPHIALAVETGLIMKGGDTALVIHCKATGTVQDAIKEILGMTTHSSAPSLYSVSNSSNFLLKVCGRDEYMEGDRCLLDYEFVHHCMKLAVHAHVVIVERSLVKQIQSHMKPSELDIISTVPYQGLSQDDLTSLFDSYVTKDEEFRSLMKTPPLNYIKQYQHVTACVKLLCERAGFIEPHCLSEAIFNLKRACQVAMGRDSFSTTIALDMELVEDGWSRINTSDLKKQQKDTVQDITQSLDLLLAAVRTTVETYCVTMETPFEPVWIEDGSSVGDVSGGVARAGVVDSELKLRVKVCALHRIPAQELCQYHIFQLEMCVYYGGKPLCKKVFAPKSKISRGFFPFITWDKWLNTYIQLDQLPLESRMCFTLYGLLPPPSNKDYRHIKEPLAWVSTRLFTSRGRLVSGIKMLGMWRDDSPADPLNTVTNDIKNRKSIALEIYFENYNHTYVSPRNTSSSGSLRPVRPFPVKAIADNLNDLVLKDRFEELSEDDKKWVWAHRSSCPSVLCSHARGLPLLLSVVPSWHSSNLSTVYQLLAQWSNDIHPTYGLELLDSQYPDSVVRKKATDIVSQLSEDDFIDLLPQLVQSLKYDNFLVSPMINLFISKVTTSPRIAHFLYWTLLPLKDDQYFGGLYTLLLAAVQTACGEEMGMELSNQLDMIHGLNDVAMTVKSSKDHQRQTSLVTGIQHLAGTLPPVIRLPLNPALQCCDIDIESCSFFNSKTLPLKIAFKNADPFGNNIDIIYKAGDDLRQDMLALQLIRLMDKIWLRAGLDLRLITYRVLSTGRDQGLVEMVTESATLRQIQTEHGLTGSFKDKPLSEWLMRYNSSDLAWKQATENFTHSCAGYCVATYVLGICDRHNDNIMVKKTGHMFHIDFGRILGNAQMFGSIKRDRVPFVLTPDMAYVINAGDKPSIRFQKFTDLCCSAFNELRKHSHLFLSLLSLLLSSNIPELSSVDDIMYVRDALLPNVTDEEATYQFTKNIEASLGTIATQINFFIHNLAQFKFSTPAPSHSLLSFCPSSYSMVTDGKIQMAVVVAYYKKFYPERYISYQIQVTRRDSAKQVDLIFRRYSEFHELQTKLVECFPNETNLPHLPKKTYLPGTSYTRETSEKRRDALNVYLQSLLTMSPIVSESDIVYTFLHCLMRDEQDLRTMKEEEQTAADTVSGKVKLDLHYREDQQKLSIMVQHARELVPREGAESIDPYVKLYLLPDPTKATKLKTKIARKTLNPTYNETFQYSLSQTDLRSRCLQLTVWDASSLLSKECIGCVLIEFKEKYRDLAKGWTSWFDLQPTSLVNRS
ncbi:PREDICTED: phosphatidylinositol 4-phosphate 3-kinase C2 domain-containing subunit beta-like [Amphimedon queenslandica]|uniref:Uncharacterized protein n=1 Tax=Amphimedon queenslandica TaxID=400682 RepID=A0A1X7ULX1_AMPQE|nr:PREDICTED: phosphatidylinositol 4-phosphate 3-kinase C2 domain-containing subunit beta-like [Amphimedon queenslandica]|eukprot:XP_011404735.1 PREDICTED: phosphatidylinositol 4-phosphate 3-kinase C2 domain-containing subunit beta-like [Amphimedon queenslandica]